MNYKSLRKAIAEICAKMEFSGDEDDKKAKAILAGCILYKKIDTLSSADPSYDNSYKQLATNYATMAQSLAENIEQKFGSFENIKVSIKKNRITAFASMSKGTIDEIYQIYADGQLIQTFNTETFSGLMYGAGSLTYDKLKRLMRTHYNVIVPIVRYYKTGYGIKNADVHVADRNFSNAGKSILLSINGVNPIQILADIESDKFNVSKYVYSASLDEDGYISILMN